MTMTMLLPFREDDASTVGTTASGLREEDLGRSGHGCDRSHGGLHEVILGQHSSTSLPHKGGENSSPANHRCLRRTGPFTRDTVVGSMARNPVFLPQGFLGSTFPSNLLHKDVTRNTHDTYQSVGSVLVRLPVDGKLSTKFPQSPKVHVEFRLRGDEHPDPCVAQGPTVPSHRQRTLRHQKV